MKRSTNEMEPVCHQCKGPLSIDVAHKSNVWYQKMVGVRVLLCSPECVEKYGEKGNSQL